MEKRHCDPDLGERPPSPLPREITLRESFKTVAVILVMSVLWGLLVGWLGWPAVLGPVEAATFGLFGLRWQRHRRWADFRAWAREHREMRNGQEA